MMKNTFFYYVFLLVAGLSIISCNKDKPVEPAVLPPVIDSVRLAAWTRHPTVKGENFIVTRFYQEKNQLYAIGGNYLMIFDTSHQMVQSHKFSNIPINDVLSTRTPFVNNRYFAYSDYVYNPNFVKIHLLATPSVYTTINVSDVDSSYSRLFYHHGQPCTIMADDKVILPALRYLRRPGSAWRDSIVPVTYFLVYQLSATSSTINYRYEKTIDLPALSNEVSNIFHSESERGYFYFVQYGLHKVHIPSGMRTTEVDKVWLSNNGVVRDTLWSIGHQTDVNGDETVISYKTQDWQSYILSNFSLGRDFKWLFIDNKHIIGIYTRSGQIFDFQPDLKTNKFTLKELLSSGVRDVNDITVFKDRVYIATNNGLFYKTKDAFFTYKK